MSKLAPNCRVPPLSVMSCVSEAGPAAEWGGPPLRGGVLGGGGGARAGVLGGGALQPPAKKVCPAAVGVGGGENQRSRAGFGKPSRARQRGADRRTARFDRDERSR